ncbi:hypothetical protein [Gulosibacter chungangensis]|uniref:hypothetical protein n=1 Tax=Gulosibacter chungangensis TaxID=979746 RepID=UPI00298E136D|nr:hypothetical protein [Gulosibacter chungangensis]
MLCSSCHRRVHAGWEIRIVHDPAATKNAALNAIRKGGGTVWFIPPANVDPLREPRLGGRKRFDLGYRKAHPPVPIPGYENASWNNRGPIFRPKI